MSKKGKWIHLGNSFEALRDIVLSSDDEAKNEGNKEQAAIHQKIRTPAPVVTREKATELDKSNRNKSPPPHRQREQDTETPSPSPRETEDTRARTPAQQVAAAAAPTPSIDLERKVERLRAEVATYKKKISSLADALEESQQEVESYREYVRRMGNDLNRHRLISYRLYNELREARAHIEFLREARENDQEIQALKKKCAALEEEKQCMEKALQSSKTKLENARKRIRKLSEERKTLAAERDQLESELHGVEKKLRKIAKDRHRLEQSFAAYQTLNLFDLESLCFLVDGWDYTKIFPDDVARIYGEGPLPKKVLKELLKTIGLSPTERNVDTQILILGREQLDEAEIEHLLETWVNKTIFVYSQELLIFTLLSGKNPFQTMSESELRRFADGHPGLEYLLTLGFEWPFSEYIPDEPEYIGTGNYLEIEESPLKRMGYTVGITHGLPKNERREILSQAYLGEIPSVGDERYMEEWSSPGRVKRLWRIAHHLHWLCYSRKNNPNMRYAIDDWSSDLDWLKQTYYHPWMRFRWPDTHLG